MSNSRLSGRHPATFSDSHGTDYHQVAVVFFQGLFQNRDAYMHRLSGNNSEQRRVQFPSICMFMSLLLVIQDLLLFSLELVFIVKMFLEGLLLF